MKMGFFFRKKETTVVEKTMIVKFRKNFKMKRRGIVSEYLPWLLIGIAILAIIMISIFVLRGEGTSLIDKIKNLFGGRA